MTWSRIMLGAICGVVATGPMTAAMVLWHRRLPARERYPLPPREITGVVLDKADMSATPSAMSAATFIAHFAFGGAAGAIYGFLPPWRPVGPIASGLAFGFLVWSLNYLGLLPALRLLRPATEHPSRRNCLMLGAHFIWGLCLCGLHRLLLEDAQRVTPALRERAAAPQDTFAQVQGVP